MCSKLFLLCLVAVFLPWQSVSCAAACSTADECKAVMQEKFQLLFTNSLRTGLKDGCTLFEEIIEALKSKVSDEQKKTELQNTIDFLQRQHKVLASDEALSAAQLNEMRLENKEEVGKIRGPDFFLLADQEFGDRMRKTLEDSYSRTLENWKKAAELRNNVEIPGFAEIDGEVSKLKGSELNFDNDEEFTNATKHIFKFYDIESLAPGLGV